METTIVNDLTNLSVTEQPASKKVKKTLFWGVQLKTEPVHTHAPIKDCLENNPELIPLKSIHTTMLYVGRVDNPDEEKYVDHRYKKCKVIVSGHGISKSALALKVDSVKFEDGSDVPTFATTQHVTVALADGIKAVDSVKTLSGEGEIVMYTEPLVLEGHLRSY